VNPRLLDVFSGAGGAARGYQLAGFHVTGVDLTYQPRYAGDEFRQLDALEALGNVGLPGWKFDAIHASPPCQAYTVANNIWQREHPDLLPATRLLLEETGLPYIIENVPGAPMHQGPPTLFDQKRHGVLVCGLALGLNVKRHRWFESNVPLVGTECPPGHPGDWLLVFGHTVLERGHTVGIAKGGGPVIRRKHTTTERGREAMGIDWMNRDELSEAIPPRYTEHVGSQLLASLERAA
jgi:DNA (cytosine-5)-methyltransferase 1